MTSSTSHPDLSHTVPAVVVAAIGAVVLTGWLISLTVSPSPRFDATVFVVRDVACVYFLTALPLALFLSLGLQHRSVITHLMIAIALLAVTVPLLPVPSVEGESFGAGAWTLSLFRSFVACGLALATTSLVCAFRSRQRQPPTHRTDRVITGTISLLVATVLPFIYVQARCRHDAVLLTNLLEQSRFGEAQRQARVLIQLSPTMEWNGRSYRMISREIDSQVRALESALAAFPTEVATDDQHLQRCRQLAMLGRTDEAILHLQPLLGSSISPFACDLYGTIYEATAQWETARGYHRRAKDEWQDRPATPERHAGIGRASARLGYCERKLGHYELAEAEYCELLSQSPTADTHFLLAQFYEDMQQSAKARQHARHAMTLAPERYQREGQKLIDKLIIGHFGCLTIFASEANQHPVTSATSNLR